MTPIVYTQAMVPERFRFIVRYNPMTYLVEVFRAPLYDGWLPGPKTLAFAALAAVSSLVDRVALLRVADRGVRPWQLTPPSS